MYLSAVTKSWRWVPKQRHVIRSTAHNLLLHWNTNVFILMRFSSLAALEVVKMTTSSAAIDENLIKMTTFSFQCTISTIITNAVAADAGWTETMLSHVLHQTIFIDLMRKITFFHWSISWMIVHYSFMRIAIYWVSHIDTDKFSMHGDSPVNRYIPNK